MRDIPDTGGGLDGLIAGLLWRVYIYFPSEGSWDWLLLMAALVAVIHLIMLPATWQAHSSGPSTSSTPVTVLSVWIGGWLLFLLWFFSTPAGQTFLVGRRVFGREVTALTDVGTVFLSWLATIPVMIVAMMALALTVLVPALVLDRIARILFRRGFARYDRGSVSALGISVGPGISVGAPASDPDHDSDPSYIIAVSLLGSWLLHLVYWYWPLSQLYIMQLFIVGSIYFYTVDMWLHHLISRYILGKQ